MKIFAIYIFLSIILTKTAGVGIMVNIRKSVDGKMLVSFPYDKRLVNEIKNLKD